jgi:N4-(beta-N-acetylglucosaminyl)-L-asparaginase
MSTTRRDFLRHASALGAGAFVAGAIHRDLHASLPSPAGGPIVVASGNGLRAVTKAMEVIRGGADAVDAVIAGVNTVEDDPNDHSVGYGGLPNEEGVVELDAAVMHGPTHRGGAVACLRNIRNPSKVARLVMERTDHVLLVGEGALRFARAHGFQEENLLTDEARRIWLEWKENMSTKDDWLPPHDQNTPESEIGEVWRSASEVPPGAGSVRLTGTIHCSGLDLHGNLSCVTTTSGLAFKIPGRVGDSPILGAGLYCDNAVGSAGSTGRGEANLLNCSSVMVVEFMRQGKSPEEACLEACQRIAEHNMMRRLKDEQGRPNFDVRFYAVNKKGESGGAGIWSGGNIAVADSSGSRLVPIAYLFKREKK